MFLLGRRSISAKHNTENGKGVAAPPTITKSYTSTKKEELLQVINKVKQQLENVSVQVVAVKAFPPFVLCVFCLFVAFPGDYLPLFYFPI